MQVPPPHASLNGATATFVAPLSAEFAGAPQSIWNVQNARWELSVPSASRYSGVPAGGSCDPSTSAPRSPPKLLLRLKHCWVAAAPASMAARLYAHTSPPRNAVPEPLKRLKVA